jgi:hypothetical protein
MPVLGIFYIQHDNRILTSKFFQADPNAPDYNRIKLAYAFPF